VKKPLLAGVALYLGLVAVLLTASLALTGGSFTFAQDDPYIHLAMARTLAEHGVWGIAPDAFASASSSPLWTLLLAALWTLGAKAVWVPFVLNLLAGVAALAVADRMVSALAPRHRVAVLAAVVVTTPLPTLAFIGMEHTLQVLLVLLFACQVSERLAEGRADWLWPSAAAGLLVATRYEGLFLVAVASAVLLWRRQRVAALSLAAAAALPVVLFALYSVSHGGLVLPNSVLMKSVPGRFETFASGFSSIASEWLSVRDLFLRPPQLVLTIAALVGLVLTPYERVASLLRPVWLAILFVAASVLHASLVKIEWFYRYEAYLIALGVLAVVSLGATAILPRGAQRRRSHPLHPAATWLAILLAIPLGVRALQSLALTPRATKNVFEQQVQLGRFFSRYYPGRPIAVNDIGAVAWLSSSRILDIVGLATQPVADLKRHKALDAAAMERLTKEVDAIAIYADIFEPIVPGSWVKVGEWTITDVVGVSGKTVTFFAPDAPRAARLVAALRDNASALTPGVRSSVFTP
jgi:hypothetical protein